MSYLLEIFIFPAHHGSIWLTKTPKYAFLIWKYFFTRNLHFPYSQVANRRRGLNKRGVQNFFQNSINGGGRKSTVKTEKFTLIYSKTITDKASRWIMPDKNASNRSQVGVFAWKNWKYSKSIIKTSGSEFFLKINKRGGLNKLWRGR